MTVSAMRKWLEFFNLMLSLWKCTLLVNEMEDEGWK
jgi:hypothetical protein